MESNAFDENQKLVLKFATEVVKNVKGGSSAGETDEFGLRGVGDQIHIRDVHATILDLLGLDDEQLRYLHAGRLRRLTDIGGSVLEEIIT